MISGGGGVAGGVAGGASAASCAVTERARTAAERILSMICVS